jgi:hypothetical protein
MRPLNLSSLAAASALLCLSQSALALATCPTSIKAVPLLSTATAPLTHAAINDAIQNAGSTVTTEITLSGTFNIGGQITIPVGKNCITLKSVTTPATLKWTGPSGSKEVLLFGLGNYGITLKNLIIEGRDVALAPASNGDAYSTIDGVTFKNPTPSDTAILDVIRLFGAPGGGIGRGWKVTNSKFDLDVGRGTAIMGYLADGVTITGNTFTNVDEAIHFQGISNAVIQNNRGTGILRSAVELQPSYATNPTSALKNSTILIDSNTFTDWRTSNVDIVLGISTPGGSGVTVSNNKLIIKGSTLPDCEKATFPTSRGYGIELDAVNSSITNNTLCGFGSGIMVGYFSSRDFTSGIDTTTISKNTISNMSFIGIDMFPGDQAYAQLSDSSGNIIETPLAAKARLAALTERIDRRLRITGNTFTNNRFNAIGNGFLLFGYKVLINGSLVDFPAVPDSLVSHLSSLEISNNTISRKFGFFASDTTLTSTPYYDQRFTGMVIPAILKSANLWVYSNKVGLINSPAAGVVFYFYGMEINPLIFGGDNKNYDTSKTFINSAFFYNTITSDANQFGSGIYTNDALENTWQGLQLTSNTLTNLSVGMDVRRSWPRSGVSGNTCTKVAIPGPGC